MAKVISHYKYGCCKVANLILANARQCKFDHTTFTSACWTPLGKLKSPSKLKFPDLASIDHVMATLSFGSNKKNGFSKVLPDIHTGFFDVPPLAVKRHQKLEDALWMTGKKWETTKKGRPSWSPN